MWVDSHAHLFLPDFDPDREMVIERCLAKGVDRIVEIGGAEGFRGMREGVRLAERFDFISAVVGLHPHDAKMFNERDWAELSDLAARHPKVVGIGETGLDYQYNHSTPDQQKASFVRSIALARELRKPLVIHDRDAHEEVWRILTQERAFDTGGVFHCFSTDADYALRVVEKGWMVAFGGHLTYPNAKFAPIREAAAKVPLDSLLIETDAPFLAPGSMRGRRCEPWMSGLVAEKLAELRGVSYAAILDATGENARRLFRF